MSAASKVRLGITALVALGSAATLFVLLSKPASAPPDAVPPDRYSELDWSHHVHVRILLSGSFLGELEPCGCTKPPRGGLAKRLTLIDRARSEFSGPTFLFESGDSFFGGVSRSFQAYPEQAAKKAEVIRSYLKRSNPAAIAVGETDLSQGISNLAGLLDALPNVVIPENLDLPRVSGAKSLSLPLSDKCIRLISIWDDLSITGSHLSRLRHSDDELPSTTFPSREGTALLTVVFLHAADPKELEKLRSSIPGPKLVVLDRQMSSSEKARVYLSMALVTPPARGTDLVIADLYLSKEVSDRDWYDLSSYESLALLVGRLRSKRKESGNVPSSGLKELEARLLSEKEQLGMRSCIKFNMTPLHAAVAEDEQMASEIGSYRQWSASLAGSKDFSAPLANIVYRGSDKCLACHKAQYDKWSSTAHFSAFTTLSKRNAAGNPDCMSCHVTGFLMPGGPRTSEESRPFRGVQCEACHVPTGLEHPGRGAFEPISEGACKGCHTPATSPSFEFARYLDQSICTKPARNRNVEK